MPPNTSSCICLELWLERVEPSVALITEPFRSCHGDEAAKGKDISESNSSKDVSFFVAQWPSSCFCEYFPVIFHGLSKSQIWSWYNEVMYASAGFRVLANICPKAWVGPNGGHVFVTGIAQKASWLGYEALKCKGRADKGCTDTELQDVPIKDETQREATQ